MLDDNLGDILTIVGIVIGVVALLLTIYSFDKEKRDNLVAFGAKGFYFIAVLMNIYNIYKFFGEELNHKSIFQLSSSIGILVILLLAASILKVVAIQKSQNEANIGMLDIQKEKLDIIRTNSKVLLKVCSLIEKIEDKEFRGKYKEEISEILKLYEKD